MAPAPSWRTSSFIVAVHSGSNGFHAEAKAIVSISSIDNESFTVSVEAGCGPPSMLILTPAEATIFLGVHAMIFACHYPDLLMRRR